MIAIIDYDAGNIKSVEKAIEYLGEEVVVTRDRETIMTAEKAILPGVGNFKDAMKRIREYGLEDTIKDFVDTKKPFLGICLGLQLLFDSSEESPGERGLSLLPGKCVLIPTTNELKVPQIGWNSLNFPRGSKLFENVQEGSYVYFVHSFYLQADNKEDVAATCEYGVTVEAAIEHDNIYACQFHPEKSSSVGLQILKNFVSL